MGKAAITIAVIISAALAIGTQYGGFAPEIYGGFQ